jgi:hypothetical protein
MNDLAEIQRLPPPPPLWLARRVAEDVVGRRIRTAPAERVDELIQTTPDRVQYYLEANSTYSLLALYPPSESLNIGRRLQRFGQAYPGLFNINGIPRAHDVRRVARSGPAFIGGVRTRTLDAALLLGAEGFGAKIKTNCFLRLEPNTAIALSRVVLKSANRAAKRFTYRLNFIYMMAFGDRALPYDFADHLEKSLVHWLGMNRGDSVTTRLDREIEIKID